MKRQNVRTLSLIVVTFTYLLLGAAMFDLLESNQEVDDEKTLREREMEFRRRFNLSQSEIDSIKQLGIQMRPYKAGTQWKFAGAFYFATTVITTIGYGHSTPKTTIGKIFCMCYAVPGIPLTLIMFQSIGERMNTLITNILRQVKHHLGCRSRQVSQTLLMVVSFTTGLIVLTCGAVVFSQFEEWTYLDAFYYCFITLTTIGFGDYVALQRDNYMAKRPEYVAFSLIFIIFGLTVVSSVMNLLVLRCLTLNTEDERRDQLAAAVHEQELKRLRGDVIWTDQSQIDPTRRGMTPNQFQPNPVTSTSAHSEGRHHFFTKTFSWLVNESQLNPVNSSEGLLCQTVTPPEVIEGPGEVWRPSYSPSHPLSGHSGYHVGVLCPQIGSSRHPMISRAVKVKGGAQSNYEFSLAPCFADSHACLTGVGHSNNFPLHPEDVSSPYVCTKSVFANCHMNYNRLITQGHSSYSLSSLYSHTTVQEDEQHIDRNPPTTKEDCCLTVRCHGDQPSRRRRWRKGRFRQRLQVTTNQLVFTNRYISMSAANSRQSLDVTLDSEEDEEQIVSGKTLEVMGGSDGFRSRRKSLSV